MSLGVRAAPLSQYPGSNASHRPVSRASQRPLSRLSQRSKQPRLVALLSTLVKQVTGLHPERDNEDIREAVDRALKRIDDLKTPAIPDLMQIETHFRGHIQKARINIQDTIADQMQVKYSRLKLIVSQDTDLDTQIKSSTLPCYLQLLLLLSSPPTAATLANAEAIVTRDSLPVSHSPPLTWRKILQEEPFEGQHWQGAIGLPEGGTVEIWDEDSSDSDVFPFPRTSDSPEASSADEFHPLPPQEGYPERLHTASSKYRGRELVEKLQAGQYWRRGWHTDADPRRQFNIGDPSTLGPETSRILVRNSGGLSDITQVSYINEIDAVREVLMALQGRQCYLFHDESNKEPHSMTILHDRRIIHLTPASQASILAVFASHVSTLNPLREFVRQTHEGAACSSFSMSPPCRTFEAFSAAVGRHLLLFDKWCAQQEENISLSQHGGASDHIFSLLNLKKQVGEKMAGTFHTLLRILHSVETPRDRLSPSALSTLILNTLLRVVRDHFAIGDTNTAQSLRDIWRESAEPLWTNIGQWLKDGIPIRTGFEGEMYATEPTWDEAEFFIRRNSLVDLGSPDFWESGYLLPVCHNSAVSRRNEGVSENGVPEFLLFIAKDLLAAGKAIGLLRALNMIHLAGNDWLQGWSSFRKVTETLSSHGLDESLEKLISDAVAPSCRRVQSWFHHVLVHECDLWKHVQNLEQVFLMMRGDAMTQFGDTIFARMDNQQPWNDYHFLNSAFRDVAECGSRKWLNPSLVRIFHRGAKDRNISRTIRSMDGLSIEYTVPFPLTYLFGPDTSTHYSLIFSFLLQMKRSKGVLDRIIIRGLNSGAGNYHMHDLKPFYALRSKLSWFVNTLLNFVMTNVIHAGLIEYHNALKEASSLDDMISIHRSHLERLLGRCLLQDRTSALHRAILSILDISLHFSDCLTALTGDTSFDVSRRSLLAMRHRRRRRGRGGRHHRPNVIGFSETLSYSEDETASESDDETVGPPVSTGEPSISFVEESFAARLERMDAELDGLVRFVRHGVESLAGGLAGIQGDASTTFGALAFSLDDWGL